MKRSQKTCHSLLHIFLQSSYHRPSSQSYEEFQALAFSSIVHDALLKSKCSVYWEFFIISEV